METQTNFKNKMNSQGKKAFTNFKDLGRAEKTLEGTLKNTMSAEKRMLTGVLENVGEVSSYVKSNWKKLLPMAIITMVGVVIFGRKSFKT